MQPDNAETLSTSKSRFARKMMRIDSEPRKLSGLFGELWEYRNLLYVFVWRDVKLRYKEMAAGVAWAILQPLLMMIVFSVFFGLVMRVPTGDIPYPLFVYSGLVLWQLLSRALMQASTSIKNNSLLILGIYFPRVILPLSILLSELVDFTFTLLVLIPLMLYYGIFPSSTVLMLPVFVLFALLASLAIGLWFSALDSKYRDVQQLLPVLLQAWFFMTPVIYPISLIPEGWRSLYALNPMVGAVEGLRWSLLPGLPPPDPLILAFSGVGLILVLVGGLVAFNRLEGTMADTI